MGIIINELFTNSVKYAFPAETGGEIYISLLREQAKNDINKNETLSKLPSDNSQKTPTANIYYKLTFADNGKGFPEELDFRNLDTLGLQLVNTLVDQLDGELELRRNNGTEFVIRFVVRE